MKRKIFSILMALALVLTFSLVATPAVVSAVDTTFAGSTIQVTSITPVTILDKDAFDAEPETLVLDAAAFDAQTCSLVVIEGEVSGLTLGAGWPDTAYIEIGLRPDATINTRNAGVYLIAFNVAGGGTRVHLQDYTGNGNEGGPGDYAAVIDMPTQDSVFRYKITLMPSSSIGGTATLEVWVGDTSQGTATLDYGSESTWDEGVAGAFEEDFSSAHLFYSIIADRRGIAEQTYSATVGDITIDDTLYVGAGQQFATIQAAIDFANPGDTIIVAAGTYYEMVSIDKSLTLLGAKVGQDARTRDTSSGESILDGTGLPPLVNEGAITIEDGVSGVIIDGFEIRDYESGDSGGGSAVLAWSSSWATQGVSQVIIQNNYLHDLGWNGVSVFSENGVVHEGFTIQFNLIKEAPYAGIELTNVIDSQVLDNRIFAPTSIVHDPGDAGVGIEIAVRARAGQTITGGTNVLVEGNEITGAFPAGPTTGISRAGINLLSRTYAVDADATLSGVTVRGNTVSGGGANLRAAILAVAESRNNGPATITNLLVEDNILGGNHDGIVVEQVGGGTHESLAILDNTITDFTKGGIVVMDVLSVQIEGNIISTTDHSAAPNGIQVGYEIDPTATTGTIKDNQVSGCHWEGYDPETTDYEGGWTGSGILVIAPNSVLEISGNEVQSCDVGLDIETGPETLITNNDVHDNSYGFVLWNAKPTINYNDIYQNALGGVYRTNDLDGILDALYNWWGYVTGPSHDTLNPGAQGNAVSDDVLFSPWLYEPQEKFISGAPYYAGSVVLGNVAAEVEAGSYAGGWNSFSTPITLDSSADSLGELRIKSSLPDGSVALRFDLANQEWALLETDYQIKPGEGFFIQMRQQWSLPILCDTGVAPPPMTGLVAGWNLVGLSNLTSMSVADALYGVSYSVVLSASPPNAEAWSVPPSEVAVMLLGEAYWLAMGEPGILFGHTTTPVADDMTWELNRELNKIQ